MLNRLEFSNEVYKSTELYHFQKLKLLRVLNKKTQSKWTALTFTSCLYYDTISLYDFSVFIAD